MKRLVTVFAILATLWSPKLLAANDTFFDYQNYNHGYCPTCNYYPCRCEAGGAPSSCPTCPNQHVPPAPYPQDPSSCPNGSCAPESCATCNQSCDPEAPTCSKPCGVSICAIAVAIIAIAAAAAIIVGSSNGSGSS